MATRDSVWAFLGHIRESSNTPGAFREAKIGSRQRHAVDPTEQDASSPPQNSTSTHNHSLSSVDSSRNPALSAADEPAAAAGEYAFLTGEAHRYNWLLPAQSRLTRCLFGAMARWIDRLPLPLV